MARTVFIPCRCGQMHTRDDPDRNMRFRCNKSGDMLVYEVGVDGEYRLRGSDFDAVLQGEAVRFGRHPDNEIQELDANLSRFHCVFTKTPKGYTLTDLSSHNGTLINQQRLSPGVPQLLQGGDLIDIGGVLLRYLTPVAPAPSPVSMPRVSRGGTTVLGPDMAPAPPIAEDQHFGPYRVIRVIAQGGMGCIYEAVDIRDQSTAVVKTVLPDLGSDEVAIQRFLREMDLGGRISHPNIIKVFESGQMGALLWLAMEYFPGQNLHELYASAQAPLIQAVRVGVDVAAALQRAHEMEIIHRDIKPGNILLDDDGRVKVIDFGLAKARNAMEQDRLTMSGMVMGTPHYMAPEQFQDSKHVGPPADVYSLAAVVYFCLTSVSPRPGNTILEIFRAGKNPVVSLQEVRSDVPPALEAAVLAGLDPDPKKRTPSAAAFGAAMQEVLQKL